MPVENKLKKSFFVYTFINDKKQFVKRCKIDKKYFFFTPLELVKNIADAKRFTTENICLPLGYYKNIVYR